MNATRVRDLFGRIGQSARSWRIGLAGDVSSLVGATLIAQALNVGNILLQVRLYTPGEVGVFVLVMAAHMILLTAATLRLENAIVLGRNRVEGATLSFLSSLWSCSGAILIGFGLIVAVKVAPGLEVRWRGAEWTLPILFLLGGHLLIAQQWCARENRLKLVAVSTIVAPVGIIAGQVAFGWLDVPNGLLWGYAVGQAAAVATLYRPLASAILLGWRGRLRLARLLQTLWRYRRFVIYSLPAAIVYNMLPQVAPAVIGSMLTAAAAGYFGMALRTTFTPFLLLPSALRQALYRPLVASLREGRIRSWTGPLELCLLWNGLTQALVIGLLLMVGQDLLVWLLGADWALTGSLAGLVALGASAQALASTFDRFFDIQGRQRLALISSAVGVVAFGVTMYLAIRATGELTAAVGAWTLVSVLFGAAWIASAYIALGLTAAPAFRALALLTGMYSIIIGAAFLTRSLAQMAGTALPSIWAVSALGAVGIVLLAVLGLHTRAVLMTTRRQRDSVDQDADVALSTKSA